MISISTRTSNASGNVIIKEYTGADFYNGIARLSRVTTLDGGVSLVHSGFAEGDMTLRLKSKLSSAKETILQDIFENETLVTISNSDGCYSGAISSFIKRFGQVNLSILLTEKVSA